MEKQYVIKESWLTKKPQDSAYPLFLFFNGLVLLLSFFYLRDIGQTQTLLSATGEQVFAKKEFWRLWTTLFVHADIGHLFSNMILLLPLSYLLLSYFHWFLFPVWGLLMTGGMNVFILQSLPPQTVLLGISGLVYWMGAAWLTLFVLIDQRQSLRRRLGIALICSVVLFIPETYKQEVSYLSHFTGFAGGLLSGAVYYVMNRTLIRSALVVEEVLDENSETNPALDQESGIN